MKWLVILGGVAMGSGSVGLAQDDPPAKLDLQSSAHLIVSETVIPIPLEIFRSLDKLGQQDWGRRVEKREIELDTNRSRSALLFGLVVSDGFIAVQAKDGEAVKRIGREVMRLARVLGVAGTVEGHANAIIMQAEKGEWNEVRLELDRTRQTVLDSMLSMRDDDLASLVSLGGWLGGTRALAAVLDENYSPEGSDLLNQPDLVRQLREEFTTLPEDLKEGAVFARVGQTLDDLESLMKSGNTGAISESNVREIASATDELVVAIYNES